jgi:ribosomal-protein-alanine N-acetyltransferase
MMNLERQSPAAAHWSRRQYEDLFIAAENQKSERTAWVVEVEDETAKALAFLVAHQIDAEWELENIVVAESARLRGVGARLLNELLAYARAARGRAVFLEVRESNHRARALYRKAGFAETGSRKNYYVNPPEDAILYHLSLS